MLDLKYYKTLLDNYKVTHNEKAEALEEEIDIIIHKLKFIPFEQRPNVVILNQNDKFKPLYTEELSSIISIAGGKLLNNSPESPDVILILQANDSLYSEVIEVLHSPSFSSSKALASNNIYIVQKRSFGANPEDFLTDVEIAAETIQTKYFIFGRQGADWVKFEL